MTEVVPMVDLRQEIGELRAEIDAAVARTLDSAQFIGGPEVQGFENEAAAYLGCRYAIGCNSGTDALLLALRGVGIDSGDEVITSAFSFFATAEPISQLRATPVFVDIEPDSFNIDIAQVEAAITSRTRAIVPVHLYGRPVPMPALLRLAEKYSLSVIEDTAQAFGAKIDGRASGTFGAAGAFSFFPTKTLGCFGDGGMVCTDHADIAEQVAKLRSHGSLVKYRNEILGYNSRLDALQAAVLRAKLRRIDAQNERRREVAIRYNQLLAGLQATVLPEAVAGHVFHQYTIRVPSVRRDAFRSALSEAGIASMVYYPTPIHRLPIYAKRAPVLKHTERAAQEVVSLPIWPGMAEAIQDRVVAGVQEFFR